MTSSQKCHLLLQACEAALRLITRKAATRQGTSWCKVRDQLREALQAAEAPDPPCGMPSHSSDCDCEGAGGDR